MRLTKDLPETDIFYMLKHVDVDLLKGLCYANNMPWSKLASRELCARRRLNQAPRKKPRSEIEQEFIIPDIDAIDFGRDG